MGKPAPVPDEKQKRPDGRMSLLGIIAIVTVVLLIVALGLLLYLSVTRDTRALPAAPTTRLPDLPPGPPLPEKRVKDLPAPALPETKVEPEAAPALPAAPPAPEKPQPSGTVTWSWQLYPVSPSIMGVQIQSQMPGYQFVALGVSIWNQSTENVPVDNNAFTLNVDNRIYRSDQFSTADAVINGLPFLAGTTLAPKGAVSGQTAFMVPSQYRAVQAQWTLTLPPTIKIVRIDPKSPVVSSSQYKPPPPANQGPKPWDDEQ